MIHISEEFPDQHTVTIQIDGRLNRDSLPAFKRIFHRHLDNRKKIILQLEGLSHIDKEGRHFLKHFKDKITIANLAEFLKLDLGV